MDTKIDYQKMQGLVPAIVQDGDTGEVLMLGFMNEEAYERTPNRRIRHVLQPNPERVVDEG